MDRCTYRGFGYGVWDSTEGYGAKQAILYVSFPFYGVVLRLICHL